MEAISEPQRASHSLDSEPEFIRPEYFLKLLRKQVVGQDDAKPRIASAFSHYTAFLQDESVGKPVLLMYGPSGSGKTFALELCARAIGLPFTVVGGGGISPAGYKGLTLRDLASQHFLEYRQAEGVIFIDEIDKWCQAQIARHVPSGKPDPEHISIGLQKQGEALRLIEHEKIVFVEEAKDWRDLRSTSEWESPLWTPGMPLKVADQTDDDENVAGEPLSFDTGRTLWIFAGAFVGLDQLVAHRSGHMQIPSEEIWRHAESEDFIKYGLMEEFVNRVDLWTWTKRLTQAEIVRVLKIQDLRKWTQLFTFLDCDLELDESALAAAANTAFERKQGARGAKQWLTHVLNEVYTQVGEYNLRECRVDGHVMHTGRLQIDAYV